MDLTKLSHNRKTNFNASQCSNIDFVIMFLANNGPTKVKDIYAAMAKFRNGCLNRNGQFGKCTYLFSREYGFISKSETDVSISLGNPGYVAGTNETTYWYRVQRGVYALNTNGVARFNRFYFDF